MALSIDRYGLAITRYFGDAGLACFWQVCFSHLSADETDQRHEERNQQEDDVDHRSQFKLRVNLFWCPHSHSFLGCENGRD